jgi:hypothetical protein
MLGTGYHSYEGNGLIAFTSVGSDFSFFFVATSEAGGLCFIIISRVEEFQVSKGSALLSRVGWSGRLVGCQSTTGVAILSAVSMGRTVPH